MQALMLAAGMGKRLAKYTQNNAKCMVEVAGERLIDRAINSIIKSGIKRFIIVIGYEGENLKKYLLSKYENQLELIFIFNKDFSTTNNIYSFYLAKDYLLRDDTVLLESDLIFENSLIEKLVNFKAQDVAVIAKHESWMDGTCVLLKDRNTIDSFIPKKELDANNLSKYYKTVNIYKFSKEFLKNKYLPALESHMKEYGLNEYYEIPLKLLCKQPDVELKGFLMNGILWYEIDNAQDLEVANSLFSNKN